MARPMREAHVDLDAISDNIRSLRATVGAQQLMAVVKAEGYGHGAVESARAALRGGADWLGVSSIAEALQLRHAGLTAPILAWLHDAVEDFESAVACGIDIGVSSVEQLDRVVRASASHSEGGQPAAVQLKVDTGLGRNGAAASEWPRLFAAAVTAESGGRVLVRALWSHLANAGPDADRAQIGSFDEAIAAARSVGLDPPLLHLAATAGALRVPESRYTMVRIGIGSYGLSPFEDSSSAQLGLRPALELSASIAAVKRVDAGSGVSYGHDYRTRAATTLVLVPLGYGDGVPRHASGRGPVSINGRTYCVAGRIAMDQFVVDVGDDAVAVGDRAVLFGDPSKGVPSADDWALAAETINYEIVTRLGARVERTYSR